MPGRFPPIFIKRVRPGNEDGPMNFAEQIKAKLAEAKAIAKLAKDAGRDLTEDELLKVEALTGEVNELRKRQDDADRQARVHEDIEAADGWLNRSPGRLTQHSEREDSTLATQTLTERIARFRGTPKNITGKDAKIRAYNFGQFMLAAAGNRKAQQWCNDHGMPMAALADHNESQNWAGGYLVPEALDAEIIDLREQYGVFPKYARRVSMASDTTRRLRRASGLTAYFVAEQTAATKSNKSWDQVNLTAKEIATMAIYSNVLSDDAVISIGDDLAGEIAYSFADKIDDCGFNGDGTSTYGGIVGVRSAFTNLTATVNDIAGLYPAGGTSSSGSDTWPDIILADFVNVMSKLPEYGETPRVAWYCSKAFWGQVMVRLAYLPGGSSGPGGNTVADVSNGVNRTFLGYPVIISQKMPRTTAVTQVCCLFGDLSLAADFGDRKGTTISMSGDATVGSINLWETRQTGILGTQRFDINVHDVGNSSATAASRQPGPIVGLITSTT